MALRFRTSGDIVKAGQLKSIGLGVLKVLKRKMSFQDLFQGIETLRYRDGTKITAQVIGAIDTITVHVPEIVEDVAEVVEVEAVEAVDIRTYMYSLILQKAWGGRSSLSLQYVRYFIQPLWPLLEPTASDIFERLYLKIVHNATEETTTLTWMDEEEVSKIYTMKDIMSEVLYRDWIPCWTENMSDKVCNNPVAYYVGLLAIRQRNHYIIELPDGTKVSISLTPYAIAAWATKDGFEGGSVVQYQNISSVGLEYVEMWLQRASEGFTARDIWGWACRPVLNSDEANEANVIDENDVLGYGKTLTYYDEALADNIGTVTISQVRFTGSGFEEQGGMEVIAGPYTIYVELIGDINSYASFRVENGEVSNLILYINEELDEINTFVPTIVHSSGQDILDGMSDYVSSSDELSTFLQAKIDRIDSAGYFASAHALMAKEIM